MAQITNDRQIKTLKPEPKRYRVSVSSPAGGGLALYVHPGGKKVFAYRYRFAGKSDEMTLGSYPAMSLVGARDAHATGIQNLQDGHNPKLIREQAVARNQQARMCDDLFAEWIEHYAAVPSAKTGRIPIQKTIDAQSSRWRLYCDSLKKVMVRDVDKPTLMRILSKLSQSHPVESRHTLNMIRMMLRYAESMGEIEINPADNITSKSIYASQGKVGSRVLSLDELETVWKGISESGSRVSAESTFVLQLIILTGCRVGEAASATRDEFDLEKGIWLIPEDHSKNRHEHTVYLSQLALQIVKSSMLLSNSEYVFESPTRPGQAIRPESINTALARLQGYTSKREGKRKKDAPLSKMKYFKPHDLRRTFSTIQAEELGTEQSVIDKMLNHAPDSKLHKTYQHAQHKERQRQAWNAFSEKLQSRGLSVQTPFEEASKKGSADRELTYRLQV